MKIPMQMGGVQEVATGIDGVTAYKCGKVVTVILNPASKITATGEGWKNIGTLPAELRPDTVVIFAGMDNAATGFSNSIAVAMSIEPTGIFKVWFWSGHLSQRPAGTVTYIAD